MSLKKIHNTQPDNFIFSEKNLTAKRPGYGLSPFMIKKLIGKKSLKIYKKDQLIKQ